MNRYASPRISAMLAITNVKMVVELVLRLAMLELHFDRCHDGTGLGARILDARA